MPTYTIDIIGVTGTAWGTFTSLGVVGTLTYTDEDALGVGDNNPDTETGALPVITGVTGTLPAGWVGQTLAFGWQQQIDGSGNVDALGMVIGGGSNFISTHLVQHPDGAPIITGTTYTASGIANVPGEVLICFVTGTRIKTRRGEVPIERLKPGDPVKTLDNGYQPIRWIGRTTRPAVGDFAPIKFRKGAIGNSRALRVSPQHRILVQGWQMELLFGKTGGLVPAKSLVNDHSILRDRGGMVDYVHLLFDTHQIIFSEGVPTESLYLGKQALQGLNSAAQAELVQLFPELSKQGDGAYGPAARSCINHQEGRVLSSL